MPYKEFDRSKLRLKPLSEREHDLDLNCMLQLDGEIPAFNHPHIDVLVDRILKARDRGSAVIFMMGAHVIRSGVSRFLIELMKKGLVTHFALNGAGAIHDFEFSLIGATTESVARYIREGQFGLWKETGQINEAAKMAVREKIGLGEAIGKMIEIGNFPYKDISLLAAGYRMQVPVTVHVGIGLDIIHEHPNCDGAALGEASYRDFLIFAQSITNLEGGVFIDFGSAVTGPEVYLKALSMARNVALQEGRTIAHFTTAVFDLLPLEQTNYREQPPKSDPRYYFRPWKTILVRTVSDGGESYYIQGDHRATISNLACKLLVKAESGEVN
ncbi:hypothetical protein SAMN02746089_01426 [Caldanaerobius fijiensis DSM 17918]|uniref:Deoxyhypusine synthase n=1 Tax=Caldanaerobius fijiensis DSM 17918 TaxID=1121256 RepID=A0A1M4ZG33_9THEO|nr:hypothetical protein [Caldanaerobius fijiensis]SHF16990.1 hypothetical protein SAMN02746089_01426 [Caldanaerobius fijiensis DSM 17918]